MVMSAALGLFLPGFSVCVLNRKSDRTVPFSSGKLTYENFMVDFSFFLVKLESLYYQYLLHFLWPLSSRFTCVCVSVCVSVCHLSSKLGLSHLT